jgi:hypothetical protein
MSAYTLEESLARVIERKGEDNIVAKTLRRQIENRDAAKGRSFGQMFSDDIGPKLHESDQGDEGE